MLARLLVWAFPLSAILFLFVLLWSPATVYEQGGLRTLSILTIAGGLSFMCGWGAFIRLCLRQPEQLVFHVPLAMALALLAPFISGPAQAFLVDDRGLYSIMMSGSAIALMGWSYLCAQLIPRREHAPV